MKFFIERHKRWENRSLRLLKKQKKLLLTLSQKLGHLNDSSCASSDYGQTSTNYFETFLIASRVLRSDKELIFKQPRSNCISFSLPYQLTQFHPRIATNISTRITVTYVLPGDQITGALTTTRSLIYARV